MGSLPASFLSALWAVCVVGCFTHTSAPCLVTTMVLALGVLHVTRAPYFGGAERIEHLHSMHAFNGLSRGYVACIMPMVVAALQARLRQAIVALKLHMQVCCVLWQQGSLQSWHLYFFPSVCIQCAWWQWDAMLKCLECLLHSTGLWVVLGCDGA